MVWIAQSDSVIFNHCLVTTLFVGKPFELCMICIDFCRCIVDRIHATLTGLVFARNNFCKLKKVTFLRVTIFVNRPFSNF